MQLEQVIHGLEDILQTLDGTLEPISIHTLLEFWVQACRHHHSLIASLNTCSIVSPPINVTQNLAETNNIGRPQVTINVEQVELFRTSGFTWEEISHLLGVGRTTLWRRLTKLGLHFEKYSNISDNDLDSHVREIQHNNSNIGMSLLQGYLQSRGVFVQRQRVRQSVLRINPIATLSRWQQVVSRRSYSVPGPNSIWHIDGHHSLIRWRFVVHGAIDGFSRMVIYLSCSTNNRSSTVMQLFGESITEFGIPSRVRSDKGGENVLVCHFMVSYRGPGRGSHIAGSSIHNQRIERLWRDVYRCVCCTFHEVFYYLEAQGLLDPDDDCNLFVLHCVFLPVINHHLSAFSSAWNQHPIRTERNWSPQKIWINGMIDPSKRHLTAVRDVFDELPVGQVLEEFGRDNEGPLPEEQLYTIDIPETLCPLPSIVKDSFVNSLPITVNVDDAIILYLQAVEHFNQLLSLHGSN